MSTIFKIKGIDKETAKKLLQAPYHSVHVDLTKLYRELDNGNGVGGFSVKDVISVLGINYKERLDDAGVRNASVPGLVSKRWGYEAGLVLLDVDHLYRMSLNPRFVIRPSSAPPTAG